MLVKRAVIRLVCACSSLYAFARLIGHPSSFIGESMKPTLNGTGKWWQRDIVWISTYSYRAYGPHRNELYSIVSPFNPWQGHTKRIQHIPGDEVYLTRGAVFPYLCPTRIVPENHYWVAGDNAKNSLDSYTYGPLNAGLLEGKVTCIIWPPARWRML